MSHSGKTSHRDSRYGPLPVLVVMMRTRGFGMCLVLSSISHSAVEVLKLPISDQLAEPSGMESIYAISSVWNSRCLNLPVGRFLRSGLRAGGLSTDVGIVSLICSPVDLLR